MASQLAVAVQNARLHERSKELGEALGYGEGAFTQANFEEVMSTHYGRMINLDDRTLFFANPEDAAEYLGFDLQPV